MGKKPGFLNVSLNNILSDDQSVLDQARIRLLYYGLGIVFVALATLSSNLYFQHKPIHTAIIIILMVSCGASFKLLTYKPNWKFISHALLIQATLLNLGNIYITLQDVNIITVQIVILVIIFGFYMLGRTYGIIYSLINITAVLVFLAIQYNEAYHIAFQPEVVNQSTVIITIIANFVLLLYMHSHFYSAFYNNIKELNKTSKAQCELNAQLEIAIERAEKSSEVKSEFLSTMSHEIRTPLNAVIGMTNLLLMNSPRNDQKENLEILKYSGTNLLSIVNDVLDYDKIESGKLVFDQVKFNLVELIHSICGAQKLKAEEKGLLYKLDVDSALNNKIVSGDPTRLAQIIHNLVNNAIKFTQKGNIWIKVTCVEDKQDSLIVNFMVKDTGIGINKDNLDAIFEPFAQESISTTRQYGGTGLGLAIIKRLLELQGLKINVSSKVNEGSEFSFNMEMPVSMENAGNSEEDKQVQLQNNYNLSSLRVLIAEDNLVNVMLMKKLFSKWNMASTIAENGERAVELVQSSDFDIILMDLQMPVLNGFDAAVEIRKMHDPKKANIPIIALTASALFDIRERVFNSGMNDYVSKPFKPDELFAKINTLAASV
ncbi:ATP-binding protein [Mucilaginibacter sp. X5P1]|uniref:ATP-binding protein n=1 Tax=Mucilaginibacter sp. X5P1 TaxID=2723088 RepID=UPI00160D96D3|nr:ATP-binding protein [Mucilaginibacter sp. X5P1]MBB6137751.1 signal transduction histidine kinase/CheY-like chemotaxis protein [Mucilaginibacter sp. X5P1]